MISKTLARIADAVFERTVKWKTKTRSYAELYDQSVETLESLAEAGDADAAFVLGDIYDQGYNCMQQDRELALKWYYQAAEGGQGDALNNIGSMYEHGDGVLEVDMERAREYYERSVGAGCAAAMNNLGHFYWRGQGNLSADKRKAILLFKKAVRHGHANSAVALGYRYREGEGCKQSLLRALYWYRVAEKADEPHGCYNLACFYYFGGDLPQNYGRAVSLLKRGSNHHHPASNALLALAYEHGSSVEPDLEKALVLYERAHGEDGLNREEEIDRVLGKMGQQLSDMENPLERIDEFRQMVFNPKKRFRVRALLHELKRLEGMLKETGQLTPVIEGQMKLIGAYAQWMIGDRGCAEWIDAALGIEKHNPFLMPFEHAALLHAKARLFISIAAWRPAIASLVQAENVSRAHLDDSRIAHFAIAGDLGYCLHEAGDFDEARQVNRELLKRVEKTEGSDEKILVRTLANLAQNEFALDNHEEVVSLYERNLKLAEKLEDKELIFLTLRDLALASFRIERADEAEGFFRRRIDMAERSGSQKDLMSAQADLDEMLVRISKKHTLQ
ncbi:tetratricopeptide repeat protein [Agrobacterium sp. BA1120]|uniref:tetratricopeptide repeat protein n=1 Tax=Agrobacterium sp. BA1120 TaxID=3228927 RepID=UPI00336A5400